MSIYSESHRSLQDQFDSRRLADRLEGAIVHDRISDDEQRFIESREFFFLSTLTDSGEPTVSFKAGAVTVIDATTIAFPSYNGNGMFYSTGNIHANGKVGILFIDFATPHRIRFHGQASVASDDPLLAAYREAELIIRVNLTQMWVNCPRYIPQLEKRADSPHLPKPGHTTPVADWKRLEGLRDVLPAGDPALAPGITTLSPEAYASRRDEPER